MDGYSLYVVTVQVQVLVQFLWNGGGGGGDTTGTENDVVMVVQVAGARFI